LKRFEVTGIFRLRNYNFSGIIMNKGGNKKSNATAPAATSSSSAAANSASARKSTGNSNNNNNNTSNTTPASEERSFLSANFYVIIAAILFGLLLYGLGGEDVDNLPTVTSTTQQALQSQQQQTVDSASTATATDDAKAAAANLQRMSLTDADKAQIKARGSTVEEVERQVRLPMHLLCRILVHRFRASLFDLEFTAVSSQFCCKRARECSVANNATRVCSRSWEYLEVAFNLPRSCVRRPSVMAS
jgi:hypothetical protein